MLQIYRTIKFLLGYMSHTCNICQRYTLPWLSCYSQLLDKTLRIIALKIEENHA